MLLLRPDWERMDRRKDVTTKDPCDVYLMTKCVVALKTEDGLLKTDDKLTD